MPLEASTRRRLMRHLGGVATAGLLAGRPAMAAPALEFNSPYNFVRVEKEGRGVTFRYAFKGARMSAIDLANPGYQVVPYTRYYHAAHLLKPDPRQVLMAGLGAGGFNRLFNLMHPEARLVTVEIDPMILRLAEEHADFRTGPSNEVVIDDARMFLRRSREIFDWILLDAFDRRAQIPVHLTTTEFFATLSDRLAEDGVMLTNLHQGTRFFASQVRTIGAVFPVVTLLPVKGGSNVIVVAARSPWGRWQDRLAALEPDQRDRYRRYGVDLAEIAGRAVPMGDRLAQLAGQGVVLTDDFAPVESLDQELTPRVEPSPSTSG